MSDETPIAPDAGTPAPAAPAGTERMTMQQFESKVLEDREFREEFLRSEDDSAFIAKHVDVSATPPPEAPAPQGPDGGAAPQGAPAASPGPQGADTQGGSETVKITIDGLPVEIPKEMFGTYLANRSVPEAILEALKGNREKDTTIAVLKKTRKTDDEAATLRRRVAEFRQKKDKAAAEGGTDEVVETGSIDLSAIEKLEQNDDLFDEGNRKQLLKTVKDLATVVAKQGEALKKQATRTSQIIQADSESEIAETVTALKEKQVAEEIEQIDDLIAFDPSLRPGQFKSFAELDRAVADFADKANKLSPNGYSLYFAQGPEGDAFRRRCAALTIAPPPDFDKHQAVMMVRADRQSYRDQIKHDMELVAGRKIEDYELPPVPKTFVDFYLENRAAYTGAGQAAPAGSRDPQADAIRRHQDMGAAADRSSRAVEVPPGMAVGRLTLDAISVDDMSRLLAKNSSDYTDDEARVVGEWYQKEAIALPATLVSRLEKMKRG